MKRDRDGMPVSGKRTYTEYVAWYKNGWLHRVDGPAVIYSDSIDKVEWYLHGVRCKDDEIKILELYNKLNNL